MQVDPNPAYALRHTRITPAVAANTALLDGLITTRLVAHASKKNVSDDFADMAPHLDGSDLFLRVLAAALKYWCVPYFMKDPVFVGFISRYFLQAHLTPIQVMCVRRRARTLLRGAGVGLATFDHWTRGATGPFKAELMAAAWRPERFVAWCLDVEEVAEEGWLLRDNGTDIDLGPRLVADAVADPDADIGAAAHACFMV